MICVIVTDFIKRELVRCRVGLCTQEVKARIQALKEKGEAFRFNDFQENKATTWSNFEPKFYLSSLRTEHLVLLAIILFSVLFILAHSLILCRPGKGQ